MISIMGAATIVSIQFSGSKIYFTPFFLLANHHHGITSCTRYIDFDGLLSTHIVLQALAECVAVVWNA
jgi:hypothetical protein